MLDTQGKGRICVVHDIPIFSLSPSATSQRGVPGARGNLDEAFASGLGHIAWTRLQSLFCFKIPEPPEVLNEGVGSKSCDYGDSK